MDEKKKLLLCLYINLLILLFTTTIVFVLHNPYDQYFCFGPNNHLELMSIKIDNWTKYFYVQIYLIITEVTNVIINDIANPKLGFSVFNPDKKIITVFTKMNFRLLQIHFG